MLSFLKSAFGVTSNPNAKIDQKQHLHAKNSTKAPGTTSLLEKVRSRFGTIFAGAFLATAASNAVADSNVWVQANTPGMGPAEFAKKNFGSSNWKYLKDENGNYVLDARRDFILGKKYTLAQDESTPVENITAHRTSERSTGNTWGQSISPLNLDELSDLEVSRFVPQIQRNEPKARTSKLEEVVTREPQIRGERRRESVSLEKKERISYNQNFGTTYGEWLGLDYKAYTAAVAGSESAGKGYSARNDLTGIELGVPSQEWAWGKYQFTTATLAGYGVDLTENGEISETLVQKFLKDSNLQERLMVRYTKNSINKIKNNPKILDAVEAGEKFLPDLLAKAHIAGPGSIAKNLSRKSTDWMKTPVYKYISKVSAAYASLAAANDESFTVSSASTSTPVKTTTTTAPLATATAEILDFPDIVPISDSIEKATIKETTADTKDNVVSILSQAKGSTATLASLRRDFSKYNSESEAIVSYIERHEMEAARLEKLAYTIFGQSRDKFLKEAKVHNMKASKLRAVLENGYAA